MLNMLLPARHHALEAVIPLCLQYRLMSVYGPAKEGVSVLALT
jgi:hypothetical protein